MAANPNVLILMVDQLTGTLFPDGPADFLHTPNLRRLAQRSARFRNCYTPSPLCVPARAAFMTGQLPSRSRVYDNAAEFPATLPTFAHYLRRAGYYTALSGKMHFVGPDQLHGFEKRLTTDIYPADFGWTPDYRRADERVDWWYHNLGSVTGAGVAEISNQLEFDDEVTFHGEAEILRLARGTDPRPWCLTVSFTHPHDPYVTRPGFWKLYENCEMLEPAIAAFDFAEHDAHSQRLCVANDYTAFEITGAHIRNARRAYFANVSYLDQQIGRLLDTLQRTGMADNTRVVFCSDHGDMLGERGLWFKMSLFEGSSRVPLMIAGPDIEPMRLDEPVSLLDVTPTLAELAGVAESDYTAWSDGESLLPMLAGNARGGPVLMEYAAEGSSAPLVSVREGRFKFNHCEIDPPQLYDLAADPFETTNLAVGAALSNVVDRFMEKVRVHWDMARFDRQVRESQAQRLIAYQALRQGRYQAWDFEPDANGRDRYMRNHMDLNEVEERARFPKG